MSLADYRPAEFLDRHEVISCRHAAETLSTCCPAELADLVGALSGFRLTNAGILARGGSESQIPMRLASLLPPRRWHETRIRGGLVVMIETLRRRWEHGASATWIGRLLYRPGAGKNGGRPVLVHGITPRLIEECPG